MGRNILLLSAGRRVELVDSIKTAIHSLSPTSRLIAADANPALSAACQRAHAQLELPRVQSSSYTNALAEACSTHDIAVIIPTIDTELATLSNIRGQFALRGVEVLVSDADLVADCRDKRRTSSLFSRHKLDSPVIYSAENIKFPCFTKLYDGSSSLGIGVLHDESDLPPRHLEDEKRIFMELVGAPFCEYTIDLYYDRSSRLKCLVPRQRLEVRSGEVSKGVTRRSWLYGFLHDRLSALDGARGCITLQVFADDKSMQVKAIEINPRFGGGYPLSYAAGADFPSMLIREYLLNETVPFVDNWEEDLLMLRYDAKVLVNVYK